MSFTTFIGIDPGLQGGIAFFSPSLDPLIALAVYPMPLKRNPPSLKKIVDAAALAERLNVDGPSSYLAVVEKVHSMPLQGVASTFSFGLSYGTIVGVLGARGIKMILIEPGVWKAHFLLPGGKDGKKFSISKAQLLFPEHNELLKKDGPAEAALLALFGSRKFYNLKGA